MRIVDDIRLTEPSVRVLPVIVIDERRRDVFDTAVVEWRGVQESQMGDTP